MGSLGSARGGVAIVGEHMPRGFWLQSDEDLEFNMDSQPNHYSHAPEHDRVQGSQRLDWIIAPSADDRLTMPSAMRYQYAPVKRSKYVASDAIKGPVTKKGTPTDDLSFHF